MFRSRREGCEAVASDSDKWRSIWREGVVLRGLLKGINGIKSSWPLI